MIQPFPFFGFPRQNPNTYYANYNRINNIKNEKNPYFPNITQSDFRKQSAVSNKNEKICEKENNFDNNTTTSRNCEEVFNVFGLKLYFDDLLIISLLIFLYNEDIKDNSLYLALVLLLLTN